ncbi:MAG: DUF721 domain-containing protein [Alphaproteobacteria bacterium]|nr:DUF721 domain-containing protein [Alphaproteobacteria bacterium]MCY4496193.1 DciA family protein [Rhodospirillaceae bacterium]
MTDKRERRGPRRLGRVIGKITDPALRKRGFVHTEIVRRWAAIVGEELSRASAPQRISYPTRQAEPGVLHVRVESARATELQHMTPLVIERVNTYFGYRAIGAVRLSQHEIGTAPESSAAQPAPAEDDRPGEEQPDGIDARLARTRDPALREALAALGKRLRGSSSDPPSGA